MRKLLIISLLFCSFEGLGQNDTTNHKSSQLDSSHAGPDILNSGFIDIINNGQVNASARFLRILIGEPGKFSLPLSIYSGVSSNNFQNQQTGIGGRTNIHLVNDFINPLSGLINLFSEGNFNFKRKHFRTGAGILSHYGIRLLTGYKAGELSDPSTGKPVNFLNGIAVQGIFFQTGAWERNNSNNVGVFWFALRYIESFTGLQQLQTFLPDIQTNGFYHGWSIGWGVEITKLVNIKVIYYKYMRSPEPAYSLPVYHFSFNYSMK